LVGEVWKQLVAILATLERDKKTSQQTCGRNTVTMEKETTLKRTIPYKKVVSFLYYININFTTVAIPGLGPQPLKEKEILSI